MHRHVCLHCLWLVPCLNLISRKISFATFSILQLFNIGTRLANLPQRWVYSALYQWKTMKRTLRCTDSPQQTWWSEQTYAGCPPYQCGWCCWNCRNCVTSKSMLSITLGIYIRATMTKASYSRNVETNSRTDSALVQLIMILYKLK